MARVVWTGFELDDLDLEIDARHATYDYTTILTFGGNHSFASGTTFDPRSGNFYLGCGSGFVGGQKDIVSWVLPTATDEVYFRIALGISAFVIASDGSYPVFCTFLDSTSAPQISLTYHPVTQKLVATRGGSATSNMDVGGGTVIATGSQTLQQAEWIVFSGYLKVHDTAGILRIKINGSTSYDINFSGDTKGQTSANIDVFRIGIDHGNGGIAHYFDDIALNDTTGTYETTYPLSGGIYYLPADGDGGSDDWTPSTGTTNWEMVDEVPNDGGTTYNESDTGGDKDLYTIDDLPAEVDTVSLIAPLAIAALEAAGSESIDVIYDDGTQRTAKTQTLASADYVLVKSDPIYVDPDTSAKWLKADINSMKVGVEL